MGPLDNNKASMVIVEPHILIPVTKIVSSFPCVRSAYLGAQYKNLENEIGYPLVLGNVVHTIFQSILEQMCFKHESINLAIKSAIKS